MVRAGFGVRMKMPPPLLPPSVGLNSRFSGAMSNISSPRKPRDFFSEPPALPFMRRPPPPLMSQTPILPPAPLKRRFFPPRDAVSDFSGPPLRLRMTPRVGFGMKTNSATGSVFRPRLAKMSNPGIRGKSSEFPRFPQALKQVRAGKVETKSKRKVKKKKKTYTLTKEKSLKKPWVNETLKTEIEKKFTLLEEAKTKNEPSAWDAYLEQKKLVDDINQALRLEYLGNHPDTDISKATEGDAEMPKSSPVTETDTATRSTANEGSEISQNVNVADEITNIESNSDCPSGEMKNSSIS